MQTRFAPEQLVDPAMAASETIIRKCVHCGFCTATCPTYVLLGDELDSPRGRIYLMKEMLENKREPTPEVVKHVDRCLSCLSCMTTCPSGVNYMHLVDHARAYIAKRFDRPVHERMVRSLLATVLPYPNRFRWALRLARLARCFAPAMPNNSAFAPLKAMLEMAPDKVPAAVRAKNSSVPKARGRVALMGGCAEPVLRPEYRAATIRLLNKAGYDVTFASGENCCGALEHHMGDEEASLSRARRNVASWKSLSQEGRLDAIIVTTSGCGTTIKDYGYMLRNDAEWSQSAAEISALAKDMSEFLVDKDLPDFIDRGVIVAYQSPCSLQHGQKVTVAPQALLQSVGYVVRTPADAHLCCGSAGTYNILQPEIAGQLGRRKASTLSDLNADVIATGNVGCALQVSRHISLPVVHTVELLDWATGGPVPLSLSHLA